MTTTFQGLLSLELPSDEIPGLQGIEFLLERKRRKSTQTFSTGKKSDVEVKAIFLKTSLRLSPVFVTLDSSISRESGVFVRYVTHQPGAVIEVSSAQGEADEWASILRRTGR